MTLIKKIIGFIQEPTKQFENPPVSDLEYKLDPDGWLGVRTHRDFLDIIPQDVTSIPGYKKAISFLRARGVETDALARQLIHADFLQIAHGLTILFQTDTAQLIRNTLDEHLIKILGNTRYFVDHVGIELNAPMGMYMEYLKSYQWPDSTQLAYSDETTFDSKQVIVELREVDPNVKRVGIGRIFLNHKQTGRRNLEFFNAEQHISYTLKREAVRLVSNNSMLFKNARFPTYTPIGHFSIQVENDGLVEAIHDALSPIGTSDGSPRQYIESASYNEGDQSFNTKLVVSTRLPHRFMYSTIVEIVSYNRSKAN